MAGNRQTTVIHARIPTIYGDGVHDDAPGLNAFFAGERVHVEDAVFAVRNGATAMLQGGLHLIKSPLVISGDIDVESCYFEVAKDFESKGAISAITFRDAKGMFRTNMIDMKNYRPQHFFSALVLPERHPSNLVSCRIEV